ncbi:MAG: phosphatidate cytidylyltransferase [Oscillospiraceae bacterium]|nr:phosphatidate cytidylyltransferase [Oscillospiraceae bacterium]
MLKRIVSALVGIAVGVTALVLDNFYVYLGLLSAFSAVGAWELIHAIKCDKHKFLCWFCVIFALAVPALLVVEEAKPFRFSAFLIFIMVLICTMLFGHKTITFVDVASCGAAAFVIPSALSCIISVRYFYEGYLPGVFLIVYLLFCAWLGDSGAYFVGTFLGKHKLCPVISPKKTVEGLIGGVITVGIGVTVQCLVYNLLLPSEIKMNYAVIIPVGMIASVIGVLGDLSASVIKRQYNVKDFGNLMPGHGGILDRFDSVLFVAPFIYVVFSYLSPTLPLA